MFVTCPNSFKAKDESHDLIKIIQSIILKSALTEI